MHEAFAKYKEVLDISKSASDAKLAAEVDELLVLGHSTKCAGCLLGFLLEKDAAKLRTQVREEMLQLRSSIGKERESSALPKKLWDKVQSVLLSG